MPRSRGCSWRQATHPDDARGKGPTLSFGLYIDGHGYGELEALLDGEEGRPSLDALRDGKPHHVVASYDAQTDTLSIIFRTDSDIAESDEDKPGVVLDYDEQGNLVSLETLDASKRVSEAGRIEFETTG